MTDIEIASSCKMKLIKDVAKSVGIDELIENYGNYKAKINYDKINKSKNGKLVLVTSIHPTPYGEGKTTLSIGINDALRKIGKNSIVVLREPSLGPTFGMKGGATGGGGSQVVPMDDINLHFTGDMHAITSCNNLLCALIDNHIYHGNELKIDPSSICFHRTLDMNDRALRRLSLDTRKERFCITTASEIMAILCLAKDMTDLRKRLDSILIGYTYNKTPIFVRDLKATDSMMILLKDAMKPNLVQSLENNPVIVHGGPFANIAHGCNSYIATQTALSLCDYVITEAGFGSDLGAEKFFDIKCRLGLKPDLVILNCTVRALKHNGYCDESDILTQDHKFLNAGLCNLEAHIDNLKKFTNNILVVLNRFNTDTSEEINIIREFVYEKNIPFEISDAYKSGSIGALEIAKRIVELTNKPSSFKFLYDLNDSIQNKIEIICKNIYHAKNIIYTDEALVQLKNIENLGFSNLPICIAKTQYSFSDDPKRLGNPTNYDVTIQKLELKSGAGFIVCFLGNIIDMPGLPKHPNALDMKIDDNLKISGLF